MALKSNLPYAFLTEQQNDWYADVPGVEKPELTVAQSMAIASGCVSRKEFEFFEDLLERLDAFWDQVKNWGAVKKQLLVLRTYDSANYMSSVRCSLIGIEFTTIVKELQCSANLVIPEDWLDELRELIRQLDNLSTLIHMWYNDAQFVHGDFEVVMHQYGPRQIPSYFRYKRMIFAIPGHVHIFTPSIIN